MWSCVYSSSFLSLLFPCSLVFFFFLQKREMLTRRVERIYQRNVGRHRTIYGAMTGAVGSVYETASGAANELGGVVTAVLRVRDGSRRRGRGGKSRRKVLTVEALEMEEGMQLMTLLLSLSMSNPELHRMIADSSRRSVGVSNTSNSTNSRTTTSPASYNSIPASPVPTAATRKRRRLGMEYFVRRVGRVEIRLPGESGDLLPVYFPIPEMCLKFSREPLKKIFNDCLPRSIENLRQFQDSAHDIYSSMCVERQLDELGIGTFVSGNMWNKARDVLAVLGLLGNCINLFFIYRVSTDKNNFINNTTTNDADGAAGATENQASLTSVYHEYQPGTMMGILLFFIFYLPFIR